MENAMCEIMKWPADMAPSRRPIHFTNELEVVVPPEAIRSLLLDPEAWPSFYPWVSHVQPSMGMTHCARTRFETNLAGRDVSASVQEFQPMTRIAWGGYPRVSEESKVYRAWIITPVANGCHLRTEETMRGPHWIELRNSPPDAFWLAHEKLLKDLAKVAGDREGR
jgi:Polyketide cyclase / dehydrase and lipid transport